MGVPYLYRWLVSRFPRIKRTQLPSKVWSLSFDANGIIHASAQQAYAYGKHVDRSAGGHPQSGPGKATAALSSYTPQELSARFNYILETRMKEVIMKINPMELLVIAVDGRAPMAKVQQQRQRRYRSAENPERSPVFDSNSITPGTDFMRNLDVVIQRFITTTRTEIMPPTVLYSPHNSRGEGEHTIMEIFRRLGKNPTLEVSEFENNIYDSKSAGRRPTVTSARRAATAEAPMMPSNAVHVVYGLDADLIMLSLISPLRNIYLMREEFTDIVSIDELRASLVAEMGGKVLENVADTRGPTGGRGVVNLTPRQSQRIGTGTEIDDFVLLMYMLGNDFLPHTPALSHMSFSIDVLIDTYREVKLGLTKPETGEIRWPNFQRYLMELAKKESTLLEKVGNIDVKFPSEPLMQSFEGRQIGGTGGIPIGVMGGQVNRSNGKFNYLRYNQLWYEYVFKWRGSVDDRLRLKMLLEIPLAESPPLIDTTQAELVQSMCIDYLTAMAWNYRYYRGGMDAINTTFYYPHYHAPLLYNLAVTLGTIREIDTTKIAAPRVPVDQEYTMLDTLLCVLPPKSKTLLPREYQALYNATDLRSAGSPIYDLMPTHFEVDREGANELWQGVAILPFADIKRVVAVRSQIFSAGIDLLIAEIGPKIYQLTSVERSGVEERIRRIGLQGPVTTILTGSIGSAGRFGAQAPAAKAAAVEAKVQETVTIPLNINVEIPGFEHLFGTTTQVNVDKYPTEHKVRPRRGGRAKAPAGTHRMGLSHEGGRSRIPEVGAATPVAASAAEPTQMRPRSFGRGRGLGAPGRSFERPGDSRSFETSFRGSGSRGRGGLASFGSRGGASRTVPARTTTRDPSDQDRSSGFQF
jgi:hypothetical protein